MQHTRGHGVPGCSSWKQEPFPKSSGPKTPQQENWNGRGTPSTCCQRGGDRTGQHWGHPWQVLWVLTVIMRVFQAVEKTSAPSSPR